MLTGLAVDLGTFRAFDVAQVERQDPRRGQLLQVLPHGILHALGDVCTACLEFAGREHAAHVEHRGFAHQGHDWHISFEVDVFERQVKDFVLVL